MAFPNMQNKVIHRIFLVPEKILKKFSKSRLLLFLFLVFDREAVKRTDSTEANFI